MPEDQHSYSSYLFRRDLIQFQLANSRKIVSDLKQAGRGIDRGQGLCPPRYEHGNAADGYRPRSRRRSPRVSLLARNLCRCRRVARPVLAWCRLGRRRPALPCPLCLRFTCAQRPARARKPRCRRSPWSSVPRQYRTPSNSPTKPAHGRPTDRSAFPGPSTKVTHCRRSGSRMRGRTRPSWCSRPPWPRSPRPVPPTGAICRPASCPPASSRTRREKASSVAEPASEIYRPVHALASI